MWQDFTNKTFNKTILTGQSSLFSPVSSSTGVSLIFSVEYAHISSPRTLYSVKYSNAGHRLPGAAWSYLHNQVTVNTEENKGKFKNQFKSYVLNSKISTFPSIETLIILGVFVLFCYLFFFLFENKTVMKEKHLKAKLQVLTMWHFAKTSQGKNAGSRVSLLEVKSL